MQTFLTFILDSIRRLLPSFSNRNSLVGTYTRELPVNMTRMFENAYDGEHLPWLHKSTFSDLNITDQGDWGWRGEGHMHPKSFMTYMELELKVEQERSRWITTTLKGLGKGTQIVTHAIPLDEEKIKVIVDFYVPKLPRFLHAFYGKQLIDTYSHLYDEDLWMMATRQQELNRFKNKQSSQSDSSLRLGNLTEVKAQLPLEFDLKNHPYKLVEHQGELLAFSTRCPHMLGPLSDSKFSESADGAVTVTCPWHGYEFDIKTRKCVNGHSCRLAPAPKINITDYSEQVIVSLKD